MNAEFRFLVIDDNADSRMLLAKTLLRKFPRAIISECQDGEAAVRIARTERLSAIVAHRTFEYDGETLIRRLRQANPAVAIVMVSGLDRSAGAKLAGADVFLHYDGWLGIGVSISEAMARAAQRNPTEQAGDSVALTPAP